MYFTDQAILRDFDRFLDYFGQSAATEVTKERGSLRTADLLRLNEQMHYHLEVFNPKSKQMTFSVLNTFFYIAKTAQLFRVQRNPKTKTQSLVIDETRVRQYDALTIDEKYFFLLEAFWCFINWGEAYDNRFFSDSRFYLELIKKTPGKPISVADQDLKRPGEIRAPMDTIAAEIFEAFGFFQMVWDDKLDSRPTRYVFPYKTITLTSIGKIMLPILMEERSFDLWGDLNPFMSAELHKKIMEIPAEEEWTGSKPEPVSNAGKNQNDAKDITDEDLDSVYTVPFAAAFLPVLPDLKIEKRLFPIVRPFVEGRYDLRISLTTKCFREIAMEGQATLLDLHQAIQELFDFDDDHLYAFYMNPNGKSVGGEVYEDPRGLMGEGIPADFVRLGEIGLYPGREFLYLFDFGDNWEFMVFVLAVEPGKKVTENQFKLLKSEGKAPKQYRSWEEEE